MQKEEKLKILNEMFERWKEWAHKVAERSKRIW